MRIRIVLTTLAILLASLSAYGQPHPRQVYIPFDFMVGRHMFPQGEYNVRTQGVNAVRIEALKGIEAVTVPTDAASRGASRWLKLVFDHRGSTPQLVKVYGAHEIGRQLAANPSKSLTVIMAMPAEILAAGR